jgi:8-oxo-dGTP pyrophosphatase MutT (NUDIX family)
VYTIQVWAARSGACRDVVERRPGFGQRLDSSVALLARHAPAVTIETTWPSGRLRIAAFLGAVDLPPEIPARVRCLVTDGEQVLVTWNRDGVPDCFPGGGAEPGETTAETAQREVWEETGWHIDVDTIEVLGWIHLEALDEYDPAHGFPHPDSFMTVVRVAPSHADDDRSDEWLDHDGYVQRSRFVALAELPAAIHNDRIAPVFLDAAFGAGWRRTA